jgi:hypothetical protein
LFLALHVRFAVSIVKIQPYEPKSPSTLEFKSTPSVPSLILSSSLMYEFGEVEVAESVVRIRRDGG